MCNITDHEGNPLDITVLRVTKNLIVLDVYNTRHGTRTEILAWRID